MLFARFSPKIVVQNRIFVEGTSTLILENYIIIADVFYRF
jgi:hypothetical protein